jgi:type IV secretion system protein VirD4
MSQGQIASDPKPILNGFLSALLAALTVSAIMYSRGWNVFQQVVQAGNDWIGNVLENLATNLANFDWGWVVLFALLGLVVLILFLPGSAAQLPKQTQFGDAHWAIIPEVEEHTGLLDGKVGIPLGYALDKTDPKNPRWRKMSYSGGRHMFLVGPTGSGKNVTTIFPLLMENDCSCVVVDPKGENLAVTGRYRRDVLGHKVFVLNPFYELHRAFMQRGFPRPHRYSLMAALTPPHIATTTALASRLVLPFNPLPSASEKQFVARCARLAEAAVFNKSNDPHWSDTSRALVNCLIMYVCMEPKEERSLGRVRELLTGTPQELTELLNKLAASPYRPLRQRTRKFLASTNEIQSVISSARTQTSFLDDDAIADSLSGDDFRFSSLKKEKVTVYLVLHPDYIMSDYVRWLRMVITAALSELMGTEGRGKKPVLFLLDEFASLGRMEILSAAMQLARGFGIQLLGVLQDTAGQLQDSWGARGSSFLANSALLQFFTPNDPETAAMLSKRCGFKTTYTMGYSFNSGAGNQGGGSSTNFNVTQTPLIYEHELYGFPQERSIVFHHNFSYPITPYRRPYFDPDTRYPGWTDYTGCYDPNPLEEQAHAEDDEEESDNAHDDGHQDQHHGMTEAEALALLELPKGATRQQVNEAWKRLMQTNHPDKGGSMRIAQLLNEARDVLQKGL